MNLIFGSHYEMRRELNRLLKRINMKDTYFQNLEIPVLIHYCIQSTISINYPFIKK